LLVKKLLELMLLMLSPSNSKWDKDSMLCLNKLLKKLLIMKLKLLKRMSYETVLELWLPPREQELMRINESLNKETSSLANMSDDNSELELLMSENTNEHNAVFQNLLLEHLLARKASTFDLADKRLHKPRIVPLLIPDPSRNPVILQVLLLPFPQANPNDVDIFRNFSTEVPESFEI